jgi:hypothetical protein
MPRPFIHNQTLIGSAMMVLMYVLVAHFTTQSVSTSSESGRYWTYEECMQAAELLPVTSSSRLFQKPTQYRLDKIECVERRMELPLFAWPRG